MQRIDEILIGVDDLRIVAGKPTRHSGTDHDTRRWLTGTPVKLAQPIAWWRVARGDELGCEIAIGDGDRILSLLPDVVDEMRLSSFTLDDGAGRVQLRISYGGQGEAHVFGVHVRIARAARVA